MERVLADRYRLGEPLGSGGMADVFVAHDEVLGRDVAVKLLRAPHLHDDTFLERFRREARAAAGLSHPNIVTVHDTGSDDGAPYIVMELVRGRPLSAIIDERGRLPADEALALLLEVCDALSYAHSRGVVHRDIKPGNILVEEPGDDGPPAVKVADFGIARAAGDDTITLASVLGTAAYLAPEQARARPTDHRADLYAAGVVLYELVTGSPPFTGGSPVQVALRQVGDSPTPPGELVDGLPDGLEALVLTALAKDPDDRYPDAETLRRDLDAVRRGQPVSVDRATALAGAAGLDGAPDGTLRLPDAAETVEVGAPGAGRGDRTPEAAGAAAAGGAAGSGGDEGDPVRRSNRVLAGLLLAALLVFSGLALMASRQDGPAPAATASPTPTAPASPSPEVTEERRDDDRDDDDGGGEGGDAGEGPGQDERGPPPGRGRGRGRG